MDAHGGVNMGIGLRQRRRPLGGGQIAARIQHQRDPGLRQRGKHGVPVGVEGLVVVMGVGVKKLHEILLMILKKGPVLPALRGDI